MPDGVKQWQALMPSRVSGWIDYRTAHAIFDDRLNWPEGAYFDLEDVDLEKGVDLETGVYVLP